MKQLLLVLVAVALGVSVYFYYQGQEDGSSSLTFDNESSDTSEAQGSSGGSNGAATGNAIRTNVDGLSPDADTETGDDDYDDRPATEIYKGLDDALAAVKKGALDYDDIILEQFVEPGEDCSFCPAFYKEVTGLMKNPNASEDERAYYSELLAISGRKENIEALVDAIRTADDEDAADIYAESLELTIGGDDVVKFLSEHLEDDNELLQESSVAAITNQGSRLAAETLYEYARANNDPDGGYEIGIGLGELIPDESTLPYLQEVTLKRDDYSHLAVKSLLNYGYDGLVIVFDALTNSPNPEFDKKMLTDAIDHVGYEEEAEAYVKKILEKNPSPVVKQFAEDILDGFEVDAEYADDYEDYDEEDA